MAHATATQPGSGEVGPNYADHPELAIAAVIYMMSRFPTIRSPALARAIREHLSLIDADPRLPPELRDCCHQVKEEWRSYELLCAVDSVAAH
ncbi:MAG: hypothetical protein KDH20_18920 [Rhodocyclaceae bacterium]|nr:hypothetical protein [Rhodocyclaceae bacterium]